MPFSWLLAKLFYNFQNLVQILPHVAETRWMLTKYLSFLGTQLDGISQPPLKLDMV